MFKLAIITAIAGLSANFTDDKDTLKYLCPEQLRMPAFEFKIDEETKKKLDEILKNRDEILKNYQKFLVPEKEVLILRPERFDDTGLIRGGVKYFIRIFKHAPKELFNMPTLPLEPKKKLRPDP